MTNNDVADARGPERKVAPTIYDVAREAGVSPSTVSRALNKPGRINTVTEARIRAAAAALDYRINPMARALLTGRTSTVGLVLSDITNPVYFDLIRGAERVAAANQNTLLIAESQESAERELESAERLVQAVDGLILVSSRLPDADITRLAESKSVVLVNRTLAGLPAVVPNGVPGVVAAIKHLADLGHQSLAFLAGPAASWMSNRRWDTILAEASAHNMNVVEIGPGEPTLQGGRDALVRVRASGVTAVIAYNDLMAIGLLQASKNAAIELPSQLSIVGFDDIFGSDFTSPALTTIRTPLGSAGEIAANLVMTGTAGHHDETSLDTELVLRDSTSAPQ